MLISKGLQGDTGEFLCHGGEFQRPGQGKPSVLLLNRFSLNGRGGCETMGIAMQNTISRTPARNGGLHCSLKRLPRVRAFSCPDSLVDAVLSAKKWYKMYQALFLERGIDVPPPDDAGDRQIKGYRKFKCWKVIHAGEVRP